MIKEARVINLPICGILYLRRYGNNLQRTKKTPRGCKKGHPCLNRIHDRIHNL